MEGAEPRGRHRVRRGARYQATAERFGLDRKTVREWWERAKAAGKAGLVPRYPKRRPRRISDETVRRIEAARCEFGWGACRTRLWLLRLHQIKVAAKTIARVCVDLGLPRAQGAKARRRAPRQLKLFDTRSSIDFLAELRRVLQFPIHKVQTDRGQEFRPKRVSPLTPDVAPPGPRASRNYPNPRQIKRRVMARNVQLRMLP